MDQSLVIAVFAGLGGMFGWGLADLFAKKTIDSIGDIVTLAWAHVFGILAFLVFVLVRFVGYGYSILIPNTFYAWLLLTFFGALQAAVYLLAYKGFGKGQLAILNPIFASFSGLTALLSIVVFGEMVSGHFLWALLVIFAGVLLLNIDIEALKSKRVSFLSVPGFKEVALATVLAAAWTLSWDKFVAGQDAISYALYMYAFMTVAILCVVNRRKIKLSGIQKSSWKYLVLIGLCETLAYAAITFGYSNTSHVSIIAILSGAFSLPTIFLARTFLKEKITRTQSTGGMIIVIGIVLLYLL